MDDMLRCSYFARDFLSESESKVRTEDGARGESVDSVFFEYGEKVGVEGREEKTICPLEEATIFSTHGNGEVNDHVERKVDVRFSKECNYASGEHACNFNNRHAKIVSSINDTPAFVNKCFIEKHAKRANINEESPQMCGRVNETKCLRQLKLNEEASARHKGWAEFEESHQAHLSKTGRVEAGRVGAPAGPAFLVAGRTVQRVAGVAIDDTGATPNGVAGAAANGDARATTNEEADENDDARATANNDPGEDENGNEGDAYDTVNDVVGDAYGDANSDARVAISEAMVTHSAIGVGYGDLGCIATLVGDSAEVQCAIAGSVEVTLPW
ncbi:hypothetical protein VNO80_02615 [Phaseolus coccineus]|uniref:Uncharacterized protein n=1 Tax=Phaseolus coccineus TaxID=3886 RepID=A0AAN9RMI8_PHACN